MRLVASICSASTSSNDRSLLFVSKLMSSLCRTSWTRGVSWRCPWASLPNLDATNCCRRCGTLSYRRFNVCAAVLGFCSSAMAGSYSRNGCRVEVSRSALDYWMLEHHRRHHCSVASNSPCNPDDSKAVGCAKVEMIEIASEQQLLLSEISHPSVYTE